MKNLEKIMKAFANRRRLAILKYLKENNQAPVTDIAHEIKLSFKSTSKHLGILAAADIVEKDQRSLQVFYRISGSLKPVAQRIIALL